MSATKILPPRGRQRALPTPPRTALQAEVLFELARALHVAGASSSRVEDAFRRAARTRGLEAEILSTPTSLMVALGRSGESGLRMARVEPGDVHLARLAAVDELLEDFEHGRLSVREVRRRLQSIHAATASSSVALDALATAATSGTAAFFFGGSWLDGAMAAVLGALVALGGVLAARSEHRRPLFEPLAAALAAGAAQAASRLGLELDPQAVTLAALIALVPGYSLTVAMSELAGRHLVSGVARSAAAVGTLLGMGLGVGIGNRVGSLVELAPSRLATGSPGELGIWLAVAVGAICFARLFRARGVDVPTILGASCAAFLGGRAGTIAFGPEVGGLFGALVLGLIANGAARLTRRPASTLIVPGLMVLVPGSLGFSSVARFLADDALDGVETAFRAAIVATSLVGGLLAANLLLPPRRAV